MQWACAKTSGENSSNNLGYFPDSQWTDKVTAVVAEDGWIGFTFKYRDETKSFDLTKPLSVYITIEEPHVHSYESAVTAPTCTEKGYTTHTCSCGDSYVDDYVEAKGHAEVIDKAVEATCTESGLAAGAHCSVCRTVLKQQQIVPALGHGYEHSAFEWEDNSCTAIFICGICSDEQKRLCTVSEETVPATELEAGQRTYTAEVELRDQTYRDTLVVIIPKLEHVTHKPGAEWHYDGKKHWKECSICGEKSDVSGHTSGGMSPEDTAWSCEICGVKIYTRERLDWFFRRMETRENYLWASGTYGKILDRYGK